MGNGPLITNRPNAYYILNRSLSLSLSLSVLSIGLTARDGTAGHRKKTLLQTASLWPPIRLGVDSLSSPLIEIISKFPKGDKKQILIMCWLLLGSTSGRTHRKKLSPAAEECKSKILLLVLTYIWKWKQGKQETELNRFCVVPLGKTLFQTASQSVSFFFSCSQFHQQFRVLISFSRFDSCAGQMKLQNSEMG